MDSAALLEALFSMSLLNLQRCIHDSRDSALGAVMLYVDLNMYSLGEIFCSCKFLTLLQLFL